MIMNYMKTKKKIMHMIVCTCFFFAFFFLFLNDNEFFISFSFRKTVYLITHERQKLKGTYNYRNLICLLLSYHVIKKQKT